MKRAEEEVLEPDPAVPPGRAFSLPARAVDFEYWPLPILVIDHRGLVAEVNFEAREFLRQTRMMTSGPRGIEKLGQMSGQELMRWLRQASTTSQQMPPLGLWSWHAGRVHTRELHAMDSDCSGTMARMGIPGTCAVLLFIPVSPAVHKLLCLDALIKICQLTRSEARVLALVADGLEAHAIAVGLGVKVSTVRSHLAALMGKTGCRRATELVRLVWEGRINQVDAPQAPG